MGGLPTKMNLQDEYGLNDFTDDQRGDVLLEPTDTVPNDELDEIQAEYSEYLSSPSFFSNNNRRTQHGHT